MLLNDGGIRAASEAEEYQAVLPTWAWSRSAKRLPEYGAQPDGTLAGSQVWAALKKFHRVGPQELASSPHSATAGAPPLFLGHPLGK